MKIRGGARSLQVRGYPETKAVLAMAKMLYFPLCMYCSLADDEDARHFQVG